MNISLKEAVEKIEEAKHSGRVFSVTFVKRTNGEIRDMNCRGGVSKGAFSAGRADFAPKLPLYLGEPP